MALSDAELAEKAATGDQAAFESLMRLHEKHIYTLALRMSRNRDDALDLSQEIFLRAYRALPNFRGDSAFSTWLYRLAYNLCLDHSRKMKGRQEQPFTIPGQTEDWECPDLRYNPETEWEKKELRTAISNAIDQLAPDQRVIITMRELQNLSYHEIAETLSLPAGTVKSRLARARETLRETLVSTGNFFEAKPSKSVKKRGGEPS